MGLEAGQVIDGKYRIVGLLGEGGMGAVYDAENVRIRRRVAIKVLHVNANADTVQRFQREAQAAGTIGNDHILEVLDLGVLADGENYMVMEFLDGENLGARIQGCGRMHPAQIVPIVRQILSGLHAVHQAGIIHRDLKPDNVYILKEKAGQVDFVKLIDFGISKFSAIGGEFSKTSTGAVMGTPYYMSPEQANGSRAVDARSDLYAVGVMLYEAITGCMPFEGNTFNELMFKIVLSDPAPVRAYVPDIDPAFETIILKAMARDPTYRFQSARDFEAALDGWVTSARAVTVPPPEASGFAAMPSSSVMRQGGLLASATGPYAAAVPNSALMPGAAPQGFGMKTTGGGSWATSQVHAATPSPKISAALIVALAAGFVLLGGGVTGVLLWRHKSAAVVAPPPLAALTSAAPVVSPPAVPTTQTAKSAESVVPPAADPVAAKVPEKPIAAPKGVRAPVPTAAANVAPPPATHTKTPDFGY